MKCRLVVYLVVTLFFLSCSNDSVEDLVIDETENALLKTVDKNEYEQLVPLPPEGDNRGVSLQGDLKNGSYRFYSGDDLLFTATWSTDSNGKVKVSSAMNVVGGYPRTIEYSYNDTFYGNYTVTIVKIGTFKYSSNSSGWMSGPENFNYQFSINLKSLFGL